MKRIIEEAQQAIRLKSITKDGTEEIANYMVSLMQSRGMRSTLQQVTHSNDLYSKRQFNAFGVIGDFLVDRKIKKGLLLINALDTGEPGSFASWREGEGAPFKAVIKGNHLHGLGAASGKLDFLAKIQAAARFKDKKLKQPIYLLGVCGSEIGHLGIKYAMQSVTVNPLRVVVGAPTQMNMVMNEKSHVSFRCQFLFQGMQKDARGFSRRVELLAKGRIGPSAQPQSDRNAILHLTHLINRAMDQGFEVKFCRFEGGYLSGQTPDSASAEFYLTSHQFEDFKRFFKEANQRAHMEEEHYQIELGGVGDLGISFLPDEVYQCFVEFNELLKRISTELEAKWNDSFQPPAPTICVNQIKTDAHQIEVRFDLRLLPDMNRTLVSQEVIQRLKQIAMNYSTLNTKIFEDYSTSPAQLSESNSWIQLCKQVLGETGGNTRLVSSSFSSGAGVFQEKGMDVAILGPGMAEGNVLSPDEYLELTELDRAVAFYERLIEKVCL